MNQIVAFLEQIDYPLVNLRRRKRVINDINALLSDIRRHAKKGLHIGAGSSKIANLINCDFYSPDADLRADATNLIMFADGSIDLIESHHMIEHLSFKDTDLALIEWRRVLCDGGLLILTFPDITAIFIKWIKYSLSYFILPRPERLDYIIKMLVGSQEHEGMFHKNAFDIRRISRILSNHGFKIEFTYYRYPLRPTPSRLVIARKIKQ